MALDQRSLRLFEACSCKPASEGLPPSLAQLRQQYLACRRDTFLLPFLNPMSLLHLDRRKPIAGFSSNGRTCARMALQRERSRLRSVTKRRRGKRCESRRLAFCFDRGRQRVFLLIRDFGDEHKAWSNSS